MSLKVPLSCSWLKGSFVGWGLHGRSGERAAFVHSPTRFSSFPPSIPNRCLSQKFWMASSLREGKCARAGRQRQSLQIPNEIWRRRCRIIRGNFRTFWRRRPNVCVSLSVAPSSSADFEIESFGSFLRDWRFPRRPRSRSIILSMSAK